MEKIKKYLPYALIGFLFILPLMPISSYYMHILILCIMWSAIGMAWNLLSGYTGQVSFGHAAFFGIGAYSAGLVYFHLKISAWWGLPLSILIVGIFSLILGFIVLRLRGPYFALATLASGEILRISTENMTKLTQGDLGIMLEKRTWIDKTYYYYIILVFALFVAFLIYRIVKSRWGYYFVAIRENQDAAESLGINTTLYKTIALTVSAVITGIAGAFYTNYMGYIDPKIVFALHDISIVTIMVVMVGGVATFWGPTVGAVIMILLAEVVRSSFKELEAAHQALFGIILIVIIIFLPNGIVGDFAKIKKILHIGRRS